MKTLEYPLSERLIEEVKTSLDNLSIEFPTIHSIIMEDLNNAEFLMYVKYRTILYLEQFILGGLNIKIWDIVAEIEL